MSGQLQTALTFGITFEMSGHLAQAQLGGQLDFKDSPESKFLFPFLDLTRDWTSNWTLAELDNG